MNDLANRIDADLSFSLRNLRRNLGDDDAVLAYLRNDYRQLRAMMVARGYATAQQLDTQAEFSARLAHGAPRTGTVLERGLRLHSGLGLVQGELEYADPALA